MDNRKEGQTQIYYLAGVGEKTEDLARSPFVEKLKARGYEVLLLSLPSDEPMMTQLNNFMCDPPPSKFRGSRMRRGMKTQDVSKKGLKYGDEDEDEVEKKELAAQKVAYAPLIEWLKKDLKGQISDGTSVPSVIWRKWARSNESSDLDESAGHFAVYHRCRWVHDVCFCAGQADNLQDSMGWSANMARIMAAQADNDDPMMEMMKNLPKVLEINPKSPLIEGLLERVLDLPYGEDEDDEDRAESPDEAELRETVRVLVDTTLVRSGFSVADPTS